MVFDGSVVGRVLDQMLAQVRLDPHRHHFGQHLVAHGQLAGRRRQVRHRHAGLVRCDEIPHAGERLKDRLVLPVEGFAVELGRDLHPAQAQAVRHDELLLAHADRGVNLAERQAGILRRQGARTRVPPVPILQPVEERQPIGLSAGQDGFHPLADRHPARHCSASSAHFPHRTDKQRSNHGDGATPPNGTESTESFRNKVCARPRFPKLVAHPLRLTQVGAASPDHPRETSGAAGAGTAGQAGRWKSARAY